MIPCLYRKNYNLRVVGEMLPLDTTFFFPMITLLSNRKCVHSIHPIPINTELIVEADGVPSTINEKFIKPLTAKASQKE